MCSLTIINENRSVMIIYIPFNVGGFEISREFVNPCGQPIINENRNVVNVYLIPKCKSFVNKVGHGICLEWESVGENRKSAYTMTIPYVFVSEYELPKYRYK